MDAMCIGTEVWNFSNGNNNFVFILTWLQEKINIGCIISPWKIMLYKSGTKARTSLAFEE